MESWIHQNWNQMLLKEISHHPALQCCCGQTEKPDLWQWKRAGNSYLTILFEVFYLMSDGMTWCSSGGWIENTINWIRVQLSLACSPQTCSCYSCGVESLLLILTMIPMPDDLSHVNISPMSGPEDAPNGVVTVVMNSTVRVSWNPVQKIQGWLLGYKVPVYNSS